MPRAKAGAVITCVRIGPQTTAGIAIRAVEKLTVAHDFGLAAVPGAVVTASKIVIAICLRPDTFYFDAFLFYHFCPHTKTLKAKTRPVKNIP